MKIKYDLHIHSCLSPCGDDSMTPSTVAGFAKLEGIDIAALTDHNSSLNCPAFEKAAAEYGLATLCGMELSTAEDIHVVCLFKTAAEALKFDGYVRAHRISYANRPDIYGRQLIMDESDNVIGEHPELLTASSFIGFNDVKTLVTEFGGAAVPAHINRSANSVLPVLGAIPPEAGFTVFERLFSLPLEEGVVPDGSRIIIDSDAHTPELIGCTGGVLELDCTAGQIPDAIFKYLRGD